MNCSLSKALPVLFIALHLVTLFLLLYYKIESSDGRWQLYKHIRLSKSCPVCPCDLCILMYTSFTSMILKVGDKTSPLYLTGWLVSIYEKACQIYKKKVKN